MKHRINIYKTKYNRIMNALTDEKNTKIEKLIVREKVRKLYQHKQI